VLGAEKLAHSLLEAALSNPSVNDLVNRLSSGKSDNLERFYEKLECLRRREHYYEWRNRSAFITLLEDMLKLLEDGASTPREGIEGVFALFEADADICESCHDDGETGMFFEYNACDLLARFASACEDKDWIADEIIRLCKSDDYGCRGCLLQCASKCLPPPQLRRMIEKIKELAKDEDKWHWESNLKTLARRLPDFDLLEKMWRRSSGELSEEGIIELAEAHFESGNIDKALAWLGKLPESTSSDYLRDELLEKIHRKNGDKEKLSGILQAKFKECRDTESLQELLNVIGEEQRCAIIKEEADAILNECRFESDDLVFLLDCGKTSEAVEYVFKHAETITGGNYYPLCRAAKKLSKSRQPLAATVLYRALLDSILNRGYARAYKHAVEYLNKLETLSKKVENWNNSSSHEDYFAELQEKHKRKRGFWSQYEH
jgi:hypothetical protein